MNQEENLQKRKAFTEGTLNLNMLSTLQYKKKVALPSANLNISSHTLRHKHAQTSRVPCYTASVWHISSPQVHEAYPSGYFI